MKKQHIWVIIGILLLLFTLQSNPKITKKTAGESSSRTFQSNQIYANQPTTVMISLTKGTSGHWIVEERVPSGWTVTSASDSGDYTTTPGKIFWIVLTVPTTATYTYTVNPNNNLGSQQFTGIVKFELISTQPIDDVTNTLTVVSSACSTSAECNDNNICTTDICSGTCDYTSANEGGACTINSQPGTCQNKICVATQTCSAAGYFCCTTGTCSDIKSDYSGCSGTCCGSSVACTTPATCSSIGGTCCTTGQTCSGTSHSLSDCSTCCVGTCTTPATPTACAQLDCEFYQECNSTNTECKIASWVIIIGAFMFFMFFMSMMK